MSFEHDKRVIIYPDYINAKRTVKQGRKVPVPPGCEDPTLSEILDCLNHLKLKGEPENKTYPRNWFVRGRIRVELKKEDGSPVNPDIPNRTALLKKVAELIPRHPNRQGKRPLAAGAKAESSVAAAAGGSKQQQQGKKGKKKK